MEKEGRDLKGWEGNEEKEGKERGKGR